MVRGVFLSASILGKRDRNSRDPVTVELSVRFARKEVVNVPLSILKENSLFFCDTLEKSSEKQDQEIKVSLVNLPFATIKVVRAFALIVKGHRVTDLTKPDWIRLYELSDYLLSEKVQKEAFNRLSRSFYAPGVRQSKEAKKGLFDFFLEEIRSKRLETRIGSTEYARFIAVFQNSISSELRLDLEEKRKTDPVLQYLVGKWHCEGFGVGKDPQKGNFLLQEAIKQGDIESAFFLGQISKDVEYLKKAASQGHSRACLMFLKKTLNAEASFDEYEQAFSLANAFLEGGDDSVCYYLGVMYIEGLGVAIDKKKGIDFLLRVALKDLQARIYLEEFAQNSENWTLFSEALLEFGTETFLVFAKELSKKGKTKEVFAWFSCFFEVTNPKMQTFWGKMLLYGRGCDVDEQKATDLFLQAAEKGDKEALLTLGQLLVEERQVNVDRERIFYLISELAKSDLEAKVCLAKMLIQGTCSEINEKKAYEILFALNKTKELFLSSMDSQVKVLLGQIFLEGKGVEQDFNRAFQFLEQAKLAENKSFALVELGLALWKRSFFPCDINHVSYLFTTAMKKNYGPAFALEGILILQGLKAPFFDEEQRRREALTLFDKAEKSRDVEALAYLGYAYFVTENLLVKSREEALAKAFFFLNSAAKRGNPVGQCYLGLMYFEGKGVEKDLERAFFWIAKAAKQKYVEAKSYLAMLYLHTKQEQKALSLLTVANERRSTEAGFFLGEMFLEGKGVDSDPDRAFDLFSAAAKRGSQKAQLKLAYLFLEGKIVLKSLEKARTNASLAQRQGSVEAIGLLGRICLEQMDYDSAFVYLTDAVKLGYRSASSFLVKMYQSKLGPVKEIDDVVCRHELKNLETICGSL